MSEKKYQIFISSTYEDLKEERDAVIKTILSLNHIPIGMELFSAGDEDQWAVISRTIDTSDYYVVIIGLRYGSTTNTGISYTEMEYDYAVEKGVPVLTFIMDENTLTEPFQRESDVEKQKKLSDFRNKAKMKIAKFWRTKDELTTMLSTSLHMAFIRQPRDGWIPAKYDPLAMGQEIAMLSKENRELREQLSSLKSRKPELDFEIVCTDDLHYTYTRPNTIYRREYSEEDISQELIDDLIKLDKEALDEAKKIIEMMPDLEGPSDEESDITIGVVSTDYRKEITARINKYNAALPTQSEVDVYNEAIARYTNMTENRHKVCIAVYNNGTLMANQVTVTLRFPPEILVFDDYEIEKTEEPEPLEMPDNPFLQDYGTKLPKGLLSGIGRAHEYARISGVSRPPMLMSLVNSQGNDYCVEDNDYLCYEVGRVMHTQGESSNYFYIVTTCRGSFQIDAELICEEMAEPIIKTITVVVE